MCTFEHINNIIFFREFFLLDLQNIWILAKFTLPETFIWFKLDFHLKIWFLIILFACKYFWVFVQNGITLFARIRVTAWKILLCVFHPIKSNNKNIQVLLWLCSWNNETSEAIIVVVRVKSLLKIEAFWLWLILSSFPVEKGIIWCFLHGFIKNSLTINY